MSLSSFIGGCALFQKAPPPIDGFCERYNVVIQEKGDGDIQAEPGPKRRIYANELTYRQQCSKP